MTVTETDRAVEAHYEHLLGERYTWMVGGAAASHSVAKAILDAAGVVAGEGAMALDLGAGGGYHARALAERGFEVIAVDSSVTLLQELGESCAGFGVTPVQGNLLDDGLYRRRAPFALILCVGDTITHLSTRADAERLIDQCADLLVQGGRLVVQFREQTADLPPENCTFTTRAERDRLMECVLHFEIDRVWVTDIAHEWTGTVWRTIRSTYPKLRLTAEALIERARVAGLGVHSNDTLARQRLLVFTKL